MKTKTILFASLVAVVTLSFTVMEFASTPDIGSTNNVETTGNDIPVKIDSSLVSTVNHPDGDMISTITPNGDMIMSYQSKADTDNNEITIENDTPLKIDDRLVLDNIN